MGRKANTVEKMLGKYVRYEDACWVWTGKIAKNGYGHASKDWKTHLAHRLVYEALVGPIPEGLQLDHLCRNKACVNPAHLEPVTQQVNMDRYSATVTHCPKGHAKEGYNLLIGTKERSSAVSVGVK